MSSFHIDSRVDLKLDFDLAVRLGEFILQHSCGDKQIQALGHRLAALEEKPSIPAPSRREYSVKLSRNSFEEGLT